MKIFVYGDSNTWGYVPTLNLYDGNDNNTLRYKKEELWWYPLTKKHEVFVSGVNGRTINNDHPIYSGKNGMKTIDKDFPKTEIDLVIIMLGTNDLKDIYHLKTIDIIDNMDKLIKRINKNNQSDFLLICPPLIIDTVITKENYSNGVEKIKDYHLNLKNYCDKQGFKFISAINCEVGVDGEHLTLKGHKDLSKLLLDILDNK